MTLEKVCVDTVESGLMTKDLALLVGADQKWLSTTGFLDKIAENLPKGHGMRSRVGQPLPLCLMPNEIYQLYRRAPIGYKGRGLVRV